MIPATPDRVDDGSQKSHPKCSVMRRVLFPEWLIALPLVHLRAWPSAANHMTMWRREVTLTFFCHTRHLKVKPVYVVGVSVIAQCRRNITIGALVIV